MSSAWPVTTPWYFKGRKEQVGGLVRGEAVDQSLGPQREGWGVEEHTGLDKLGRQGWEKAEDI